MNEKAMDHSPNPQPNLTDKYLTDLQEVLFFKGKEDNGSLAWFVDYYNKHAGRTMRWFRLFGVLVIVLSASLPLLAAYEAQLPGGTMIVSLVAVLIAIATGISTFFRWDVGCQGYIGAKLALLDLESNGHVKIAWARREPDAAGGLTQAQEATEQFMRQAHLLVMAETKGYFDMQRNPDGQEPRPPVGPISITDAVEPTDDEQALLYG